jgi:hypothetical protein
MAVKKAAGTKKKDASSAKKAASTKKGAAKKAAPKKTGATKKAAPKKGVKKAGAAAPKLSSSQSDLLQRIGTAGDAGYRSEKKAEQRSIDSLQEKKLIKRGAKDKATGSYPYSLSNAGKKHLSSQSSSSSSGGGTGGMSGSGGGGGGGGTGGMSGGY